ncbi:MAG: hypothetical protein IJT30_11635 [Muribaculaceae bacterium]|nr:hypothetical protein [Muribaculaceae bacterium]
MKRLHFTCTLRSDVILNQRAATAGNQQTLDFIPGNSFLGIVAGKLYNDDSLSDDDKLRLFHTGEVRYGDAHPVLGDMRTLRVPASMYYPKGKKVSDRCFIHHGYDRDKDPDKLQLKQCRSGFYAFAGGEGREMRIDTSFAIKSAYDSAKRRSEDERMYGYESLPAGLVMTFDVELDDTAAHLADSITRALTGKRQVGRSRTAQYGLVEIKSAEATTPDYTRPTQGEFTTVYADGRLIFIDTETGEPTFRPTAEQLGLTGGEVVWHQCQVRTFQYAPWNGKRMTRDTDRCGIEKGSVFVVKNARGVPTESTYVGNYRNEGFGRVIYNPAFLDYDASRNGEAKTRMVEPTKPDDPKPTTDIQALKNTPSPLLQYLGRTQERINDLDKIYTLVNDFAERNKEKFKKDQEAFASQWGGIRAIATRMARHSNKEIWDAVNHYLSHGTTKEKWEQYGRKLALQREFVEKVTKEGLLREALVNLGAEMAKLAKKGGKK